MAVHRVPIPFTNKKVFVTGQQAFYRQFLDLRVDVRQWLDKQTPHWTTENHPDEEANGMFVDRYGFALTAGRTFVFEEKGQAMLFKLLFY